MDDRRRGRVLVVCQSNVGRSQVAQAFIEKCMPHLEVTSAGTDVGNVARPRDGFPVRSDIVDGAQAFGIDLKGRKRARLVESLADWAGEIIVVMNADEARQQLPGWFSKYEEKVTYWRVEDLARVETTTPENIRLMIEQIQRIVTEWCAAKEAPFVPMQLGGYGA